MSFSQGNTRGRTVTLHMVSSLDGFIAKHDNTVAWMDTPGSVYEPGVSISEEEVATFLKSIDCYVLGSRTYEHALQLGWPYGDTPVVVVTTRKWPQASTRKSIEFYSGDLNTLVDEKLAPRYRNIWLVGGAVLSQHFSGTRPRGRNQVNDCSRPVRRRPAPVRRFPEGQEVELKECNRL